MNEAQFARLLEAIRRAALAADVQTAAELAACGLTMVYGACNEGAEAWREVERLAGIAPA